MIFTNYHPQDKFRAISCMGKFCPPATASPNLLPRNKYMVYYCAIGRELGRGGVLLKYWQVSASLGLGFVFEQAGTDLKNKKNQERQQDHKLDCGKKYIAFEYILKYVYH